MMLSLLQQQVYQVAKYGSKGENAFVPVIGEQAEWCFKVLPWWRQEEGQGEGEGGGPDLGGHTGR